jgi:hypothetical protein
MDIAHSDPILHMPRAGNGSDLRENPAFAALGEIKWGDKAQTLAVSAQNRSGISSKAADVYCKTIHYPGMSVGYSPSSISSRKSKTIWMGG